MLDVMRFEPLALVVICANVLGGAMALPQALKLLRDRRIVGISPAWVGISVTVNAWWGAYGVGTHDWGIMPVSVVSVMSYLVIGLALTRFASGPGRTVALPMFGAALASAAVPLVVLLLDGWTTAGLVLGAMYGVQLSPAVIAVYRAADVSGVAPATWLIAFVEAVLWGGYGFARTDLGLVALGVTGLVMSSLVLARLLIRRPRRATAGLGFGIEPVGALA